MVSYERLWIYLIKMKKNASSLAADCGISLATMARMKKGLPVSLDVIDRICLELDCKIEDVVEIKKTEES